jgi:hypothetical protein
LKRKEGNSQEVANEHGLGLCAWLGLPPYPK